MSVALDNFRNGFLYANSWEQRKDGVPFYLLDKLSPDEKRVAEDELIGAIHPGDSWPVSGLGHLRSQKSLTALYDLLPRTKKLYRITVAHAIFLISGDKSMIQEVLEEIPRITDQTALIDAIYLLPAFNAPQTEGLLEKFRDHEEYLVAYNATRALNLPTDPVVEKFRNKKIIRASSESQNKPAGSFSEWLNKNFNPFYNIFRKQK